MKKINISSLYLDNFIQCIKTQDTYNQLTFIGAGSEGLVVGDDKKAIKIYRPFYDKITEYGCALNDEILEKYLQVKRKTNEYVENRKTKEMVTANALIYLPEFSLSTPIGCSMDKRTLNSRYPNFYKLKDTEDIDKIIEKAIQISDAIKSMHSQDTIHTDIHGKNIGITDTEEICIFDCDGCYIGQENYSKKPSTVEFYERYNYTSQVKAYDRYCLSLMVLDALSKKEIRYTSRKQISRSIKNLKIESEEIKLRFKTLLNPLIDQEYIGDFFKQKVKSTKPY